jgi:hypothetical protein
MATSHGELDPLISVFHFMSLLHNRMTTHWRGLTFRTHSESSASARKSSSSYSEYQQLSSISAISYYPETDLTKPSFHRTLPLSSQSSVDYSESMPPNSQTRSCARKSELGENGSRRRGRRSRPRMSWPHCVNSPTRRRSLAW